MLIKPLKHKFKAIRCEYDGWKFASKKEFKRYMELQQMLKTGEIEMFLRQTPFHLQGGVKYVCDFQVFYSDGYVKFEDVKGMRTPLYIAKKKLVEANYPIEIIEI